MDAHEENVVNPSTRQTAPFQTLIKAKDTLFLTPFTHILRIGQEWPNLGHP